MALEEYKLKHGTIKGFPGARAWDGAKEGPLIEAQCDILGACAKEKVRTRGRHKKNDILRWKLNQIWNFEDMTRYRNTTVRY